MIGWSRALLKLAKLVVNQFPDLTEPELKLLCAATMGQTASFGHLTDNSYNNPDFADFWGLDRDIRAGLIRWLCVHPDAANKIDPRGIRIRTVRLSDQLDLSFAIVKFPLVFLGCNIKERIILSYAQIELLQLTGSVTSGIEAEGLSVRGDLILEAGFRAQGSVNLQGADIRGNLECGGGSFINQMAIALNADAIKIAGDLTLARGFCAEGSVRLIGAMIGGDLNCRKGKFLNGGGRALIADRAKVVGSVFFNEGFSAEGAVRLVAAEIGSNLLLEEARFAAKSSFDAERITVRGGFIWRKLGPNLQAELKLLHASTGPISDDQESWPQATKLNLDGFIYTAISNGPVDATSRLRWLHLQNVGEPSWIRRAIHGALYGGHTLSWKQRDWPDFRPQPYQQLAKVLGQAGDKAAVRRVMIDMEDARRKYGNLKPFAWLWRWLLWLTIRYGYKPWHALYCSLVIVAMASVLFGLGYNAGAITPTDKDAYRIFETNHAGRQREDPPWYYQEFCAPVYSVDTFLPIINFGQKDHWMPNPHKGVWGEFLRVYLWVHIGLGWLLTTLFVAGLTPIVRSG
jgi:hypothetical protein